MKFPITIWFIQNFIHLSGQLAHDFFSQFLTLNVHLVTGLPTEIPG